MAAEHTESKAQKPSGWKATLRLGAALACLGNSLILLLLAARTVLFPARCEDLPRDCEIARELTQSWALRQLFLALAFALLAWPLVRGLRSRPKPQ